MELIATSDRADCEYISLWPHHKNVYQERITEIPAELSIKKQNEN